MKTSELNEAGAQISARVFFLLAEAAGVLSADAFSALVMELTNGITDLHFERLINGKSPDLALQTARWIPEEQMQVGLAMSGEPTVGAMRATLSALTHVPSVYSVAANGGGKSALRAWAEKNIWLHLAGNPTVAESPVLENFLDAVKAQGFDRESGLGHPYADDVKAAAHGYSFDMEIDHSPALNFTGPAAKKWSIHYPQGLGADVKGYAAFCEDWEVSRTLTAFETLSAYVGYLMRRPDRVRLLIIEGPKACGKTRLVKAAFSNVTGHKIVPLHHGGRINDAIEAAVDLMVTHPMIFDDVQPGDWDWTAWSRLREPGWPVRMGRAHQNTMERRFVTVATTSHDRVPRFLREFAVVLELTAGTFENTGD